MSIYIGGEIQHNISDSVYELVVWQAERQRILVRLKAEGAGKGGTRDHLFQNLRINLSNNDVRWVTQTDASIFDIKMPTGNKKTLEDGTTVEGN